MVIQICVWPSFVIFAKPSISTKPTECSFDDPFSVVPLVSANVGGEKTIGVEALKI